MYSLLPSTKDKHLHIAILTLILAFGKQILEKESDREELRAEIRNLFNFFLDYSMIADNPYVQAGVRLAFLRVLREKKPPKGEEMAAFTEELDNLFPDAGENFILRLIKNFRISLDNPNTFSEERINLDIALRKEAQETMREFFHSDTQKNKEVKSVGTSTNIISCPKCDEKKRCDKNTKRFHCKKCGFKAAFRNNEIVVS